jgi:hypothetical protein
VRVALCLAALFTSTAAFAQSSAPPGPYIIDLRGGMIGAPSGDFYPAAPAGTQVPQRGFGFSVGGHIYPFRLGVAQVGLGADLLRARGSTSSAPGVNAAMRVTTVAPQISFNFGTRDGWSYLSAGYGVTQTRAQVDIPEMEVTPPETQDDDVPEPEPLPVGTVVREDRTGTINLGGGARWFIREHLAVGFDVRFHRLSATAGSSSKQIVGLTVGLSLR